MLVLSLLVDDLAANEVEVEAEPREVSVRMLGDFGVSVRGRRPKFRSHTAERLLALLALRLGRTAAKSEALSTLWPESDGDRQAQNLRRAISDVRQAIEMDPGSPLILLSPGDKMWLDAEFVWTDVAQFKSYTDDGLENADRESSLRSAIELYEGPLLPGNDDPWVVVHRMELEERFAQAVEQMIGLLLRENRHDEALRIGKRAVTAAPLREDIHIAVMSAYASAGLKSQAIRQFEELETLLSDEWGETPSPKSLRAFEDIGVSSPVRESPVGETIGGAMPLGSPFYVMRECDTALRRAIERSEGTVLIHGSRQVGKTSLLFRVLSETRVPRVVTDFQVLNKHQLADADSFCRALAYGFATQLGVKLDLDEAWNSWIGPNANLDAIVERVLNEKGTPVVWAMDEADRLFGCDFADDFFGLVRSWHNRRGIGGPFAHLTLAIAYATEAHLFIGDVNQSPFNVGLRVPVRDFGEAETRELAGRYKASLNDADVRQLVQLTGGQPFLTRKALDKIVLGGTPLGELQATCASEDGPFGDHLRRLIDVATRDDATKAEIVRFLDKQPFKDPRTPLRLVAGGMLRWGADGKLDFRVPAYREFLKRYLSE